MIRIYRDIYQIKNNPGSQLFAIIRNISSIVLNAAEQAYNRSALNTTRAKQKNWGDEIDNYLAGKKTDRDDYRNAFYGSAVEDIANINIAVAYKYSVSGYRVFLQDRRDGTIPDIVIKDLADKDQAWLDITSEHSAGHIFSKSSTGWTTTDFVAELLYPKLDMTNIRNTDKSYIGARTHALSTTRLYEVYRDKVDKYFEARFSAALNDLSKHSPISLAATAMYVEAAFNVYFPENRKHPAIKSMLQMYCDRSASDEGKKYAHYLLTQLYKDSSQDKSYANAYITKSYEQYSKQKQPS